MEYRTPRPENQSIFQRFGSWCKLKIYQTEVTFSVYMFTPVEKFVFWSTVFLFFSLTFIALILYLPQHIMFIINRAWFYAGLDGASSPFLQAVHHNKEALSLSVSAAASSASSTAGSTATAAAETVLREL